MASNNKKQTEWAEAKKNGLKLEKSNKEYSEQDTKMEGSCLCLDSGNVPKTSGKSPDEKGFNKECTDS